MNILIISANPKEKNHTDILVKSYTDTAIKKGHDVRHLSIYSTEFTLPFATGMRTLENDPSLPIITKSKELITWADELVFIHPIWWSYMPAGLKNWIDAVMTPGFAYKYVDGKPVALLSKKAKVFCTAGSYAPYYIFPLVKLCTPLHLLWKFALLRFCGIDLIDFNVCDKMNINNSNPPEGHFEKFVRRVEFSAEFIH